jgi:hypothetical protein
MHEPPAGRGNCGTMLKMAMSSRKNMRRRSMLGTVLFVLGIMASIASLVTGSIWLMGAAMALLVPAAVMLYQVGKSLPR